MTRCLFASTNANSFFNNNNNNNPHFRQQPRPMDPVQPQIHHLNLLEKNHYHHHHHHHLDYIHLSHLLDDHLIPCQEWKWSPTAGVSVRLSVACARR